MLPYTCTFVLILISLDCIYSQEPAELSAEVCRKYKQCGDCISADPKCAWCTDKLFPNSKFRCDLKASLLTGGCKNISDPAPSKEIDGTQKKLKDYGSADDANSDAVQLSPQRLTIHARPKETVDFDVEFYLAKNYPVDLYYVMDLSYSMLKHKKKLAQLGTTIASRMVNITENFKIGFGSFVDKVTMPYVNMLPRKLENPCDSGVTCTSPYGFRHHLALTPNAKEFEKRVNDAPVSGNLDSPEGGFDAIMQAAVCQNKIGWRDFSRKLMIYSTDAGFHYAGDGKLGGIVTPNDMACHLERSGPFVEYSMSTQLDYPSISQIREVLDSNSIVLIFAVTEGKSKLYEELKAFLKDTDVGKLKDDSSNVVELIEKVYNQISSKVELTSSNTENVKLAFRSECLGSNIVDTNQCTGLHIGDKVKFKGQLTVSECPDDPSKPIPIEISPGGGLTEKLVLNVYVTCQCECEKISKASIDDPYCSSGNGTLACGICACNLGFAGSKCECKTDDLGNQELDEMCRRPNSTNTDLCESKGECICGECHCFTRTASSSEKYSGPYCECDDFSCDYHQEKVCAGNGKCKCGHCDCNPGFTGDACECPDSNASCVAKNGKICNGYGECKCGKCECDLNKDFRGPKCEDCPVGCGTSCDITRDCVQCLVFGTGDLSNTDQCKKNCSSYQVHKWVKAQKREGDIHSCRFQDLTDECWFVYTYGYDDQDNFVINAQETKEGCPTPVNILAIVLGVVGGIVAIGLALLLIWKILTTIHDRREFAKFEKERERAKWDTGENPIYKQATTNFKNPTYKQGQM